MAISSTGIVLVSCYVEVETGLYDHIVKVRTSFDRKQLIQFNYLFLTLSKYKKNVEFDSNFRNSL